MLLLGWPPVLVKGRRLAWPPKRVVDREGEARAQRHDRVAAPQQDEITMSFNMCPQYEDPSRAISWFLKIWRLAFCLAKGKLVHLLPWRMRGL